jgi:hypothetical protein
MEVEENESLALAKKIEAINNLVTKKIRVKGSDRKGSDYEGTSHTTGVSNSKVNVQDVEYKKNFDFLTHKRRIILKLINEEAFTGFVLSDNVYLYESPNVRSKFYYDFVLSANKLFILDSEKNNIKLVFRLENLVRVSISFKNFNLIVSLQV